MQTHQILQSNVNIVRITNLKKGNVFKMIEDTGYGEPSMAYGVVLDLFNDGNKTFVQILKYKLGYDFVEAEIKVLSGTKDVSIFPASKEEVENYFKGSLEGLTQKIASKKEELFKLEKALSKAKEFVDGELSNTLSKVEYSELPPSTKETTF